MNNLTENKKKSDEKPNNKKLAAFLV